MNKEKRQEYKRKLKRLHQRLKHHPLNARVKAKIENIDGLLKVTPPPSDSLTVTNIVAIPIAFPITSLTYYGYTLGSHPYATLQFNVNTSYVVASGGKAQAIAGGYNVYVDISNNPDFNNGGGDVTTRFTLNWDKSVVVPSSWIQANNNQAFDYRNYIKIQGVSKSALKFKLYLYTGTNKPWFAYGMGLGATNFGDMESYHGNIHMTTGTAWIRLMSSFPVESPASSIVYSKALPTSIPLKGKFPNNGG